MTPAPALNRPHAPRQQHRARDRTRAMLDRAIIEGTTKDPDRSTWLPGNAKKIYESEIWPALANMAKAVGTCNNTTHVPDYRLNQFSTPCHPVIHCVVFEEAKTMKPPWDERIKGFADRTLKDISTGQGCVTDHLSKNSTSR